MDLNGDPLAKNGPSESEETAASSTQSTATAASTATRSTSSGAESPSSRAAESEAAPAAPRVSPSLREAAPASDELSRREAALTQSESESSRAQNEGGVKTKAASTTSPTMPRSDPNPQNPDKSTLLQEVARAIRDCPWVFVSLVALISGLGVAGVLTRFGPRYRAEAELRIAPLAPRVLYTDEEWHKESFASFYDQFVETVTRRVEASSNMKAAMTSLESQNIDWIPDGVSRHEQYAHLRARLEVKRLRDTHLVVIGFEDQNARVSAAVVNAVARAFVDGENAERQSETSGLIKSLAGEEAELRGRLEATHEELDTLSDRLGSAIIDDRQNIFYERIQLLEQGLTKILVQRVEAEGRLEAVKVRAARLIAIVPLGAVAKALEEDDRVGDARVMIARRQRQLDDQLLGLGEKHPHRPILEARRDGLADELETLERSVAKGLIEAIAARRDEEAMQILGEADRELGSLRASEEQMQRELSEAKRDLADYGRAMFDGKRLRAESARLLEEMQRVESRLTAVQTEAEAPSRLKLHQLGRVPGKPHRDRRLPLLLAVALFALIGSAAATRIWFLWRHRQWQRAMA